MDLLSAGIIFLLSVFEFGTFGATMSSRTEGKTLRDAGYVPHYPVIIVPGLASSGLVLEAGNQAWLFERVWLSIAKLGFSMVNKHRKKEIHVTVDPNDNGPVLFSPFSFSLTSFFTRDTIHP